MDLYRVCLCVKPCPVAVYLSLPLPLSLPLTFLLPLSSLSSSLLPHPSPPVFPSHSLPLNCAYTFSLPISSFSLLSVNATQPQSSGTSTRSSRLYPVRRSTVVVQGEKLVIRKLVVAGIVSAEKSYIDCLHVMKEVSGKGWIS